MTITENCKHVRAEQALLAKLPAVHARRRSLNLASNVAKQVYGLKGTRYHSMQVKLLVLGAL
jgi:hypothetical protein